MTTPDYGPAGNTYDKFNSKNPISNALVQGFLRSLTELIDIAAPRQVLEVGCGEGHIQKVLERYPIKRRVAFDIDYPIVVEARDHSTAAQYLVANGETLPFPAGYFDLVMAIEVLEHVPQPPLVLQEMARITTQYCIVSVPREPIWRVLNMVRGKYIGAMGNTPGHIQHWSANSFTRLVGQHFEIVAVRQPLPWTMILCKKR